jgi:hypothetical protein
VLETVRKICVQKAMVHRIYKWKDTMFRLDVWVTNAVNRRRRKKNMLSIYWDRIVARFNLLLDKGQRYCLQPYGGIKLLDAVDSPKKERIIYDFIV